MEVTLRNGFCELTMDEMQVVDGGELTFAGAFDTVCMSVTAAAAGGIVASFFPPGGAAYMAAAVTAGLVGYVWQNI